MSPGQRALSQTSARLLEVDCISGWGDLDNLIQRAVDIWDFHELWCGASVDVEHTEFVDTLLKTGLSSGRFVGKQAKFPLAPSPAPTHASR